LACHTVYVQRLRWSPNGRTLSSGFFARCNLY